MSTGRIAATVGFGSTCRPVVCHRKPNGSKTDSNWELVKTLLAFECMGCAASSRSVRFSPRPRCCNILASPCRRFTLASAGPSNRNPNSASTSLQAQQSAHVHICAHSHCACILDRKPSKKAIDVQPRRPAKDGYQYVTRYIEPTGQGYTAEHRIIIMVYCEYGFMAPKRFTCASPHRYRAKVSCTSGATRGPFRYG